MSQALTKGYNLRGALYSLNGKEDSMKIGDTVMLKTLEQGRSFKGKIIRILPPLPNTKFRLIRVGLPNGLYAEFPEHRWKLIDEERSDVTE